MVLVRADQARRYNQRPVYLKAAALRSRRFGYVEVFSPWLAIERAESPTVNASQRRLRARRRGTRRRRRRPDPGHRVRSRDHPHQQERLCKHGGGTWCRPVTEIAGSIRSTPTAGAWPTANRSARWDCAVYESMLQLRGDAGPRQVPNDPPGPPSPTSTAGQIAPARSSPADVGRAVHRPVRPGKQLDWSALEHYVRTNLPDLDGEFQGYSSPQRVGEPDVFVQVGEQALVVRRPPSGSSRPALTTCVAGTALCRSSGSGSTGRRGRICSATTTASSVPTSSRVVPDRARSSGARSQSRWQHRPT